MSSQRREDQWRNSLYHTKARVYKSAVSSTTVASKAAKMAKTIGGGTFLGFVVPGPARAFLEALLGAGARGGWGKEAPGGQQPPPKRTPAVYPLFEGLGPEPPAAAPGDQAPGVCAQGLREGEGCLHQQACHLLCPMGSGLVLCLGPFLLVPQYLFSAASLSLPHRGQVDKACGLQPALLGLLVRALISALLLRCVCKELGAGQPTRPLCQLRRLSARTQQ